jgi:PAS domain S-box-containing protein
MLWGVWRLLSQRKRAEEALMQSERRIFEILSNIADCHYTLDKEWRVTRINDQALRYFGMRKESFLDQPFWEIFPIALGSVIKEQHKRAFSEQVPVHYELLSPITARWAEVHVYPSEGGLPVYFRDITERKRVEEERERLIHNLQDALAKSRRLHGMLPICVSGKKIRDDEGYWNQLEAYIEEHSEAEFTHGLCPDCMKKLYGISFDYPERNDQDFCGLVLVRKGKSGEIITGFHRLEYRM